MTSGSKTALREAALWCLAMVLVFLSVFYADRLAILFTATGVTANKIVAQKSHRPSDLQTANSELAFAQEITIKAQANGHYFAQAEINGKSIPVLIDTGATFVSLTYKDAEAAGLHIYDGDFTHQTETANGMARVAKTTLAHVRIGNISLHDVEAIVSEPGRQKITLLGMSFLGRLKTINMQRDRLTLIH